MSQKYGKFTLDNKDLSLGDGEKGVSCFFENVCVKNGVKSKYSETSFAQVIEPQRETAIDEIISNLGGLKAVFQYKTFVNGEEKVFLILCSCQYVLYYYEMYKTVPQLLCFDSINISGLPHFETFSLQDKNLLIISTKEDEMWVWDGENNPYEVLDSPKIASATIGLGRLFVSTNDKPYSICYSEDLDPSTWSMSSGDIMEINFADNLGKVIKVVSLDNYVFAIRERGIIKIYSKTNGELATSKIMSFGGNIFADSICECGDKIIFCSTAGVYKFDGVNIKQIYKNFDVLLQSNYVNFAICKDNNYYLFLSDKSNSFGHVFVFDNIDEKIYDICKIEPMCSAFLVDVYDTQHVGYVTDESSSKSAKMPLFLTKTIEKTPNLTKFLFKTKKICLSDSPKSTSIVYMDILSKTNIHIEISTDLETKNFDVNGSNYFQRIMLNMRGSFCEILIDGSSGANIDSFVITYCYMGGN